MVLIQQENYQETRPHKSDAAGQKIYHFREVYIEIKCILITCKMSSANVDKLEIIKAGCE